MTKGVRSKTDEVRMEAEVNGPGLGVEEGVSYAAGSVGRVGFRRWRRIGEVARGRHVFGLAWLVSVIVVESVIFDILNSRFLTVANLQTVGYEAAFDGILAVGLTFAMICNTLDISFAAVAGLVGMILAVLATNLGVSLGVAIAVGLVIGCLAGVVNGLVIVFAAVGSSIMTSFFLRRAILAIATACL